MDLSLNLPQEKEERHQVTLIINGKSFAVERETLAANTPSLMLRNLLTTKQFSEATTDRVEIELPPHIKLDEDSMQKATNALFDGQLPNELEIDGYLDLALFFSYFQAEDLFKACLGKINLLNPTLFDWIGLLRFPDELVDGMIAELSQDSAAELLKALQALSIDAIWKNFDPKTTALTSRTQIIEEIRGEGWTVNMRRFAIALASRAETPLSEELLDYFGADIQSLRSGNLRGSSRPIIERVMTSCPNLEELILDCKVDDIDTFLPEVLKHFPGLLKLKLVRARGNALQYLDCAPRLTHLDIADCIDLEPDALKHLAHTPMLLHLNISNCSQLEPDALKHLAFVIRLQHLNISRCNQLERDALKHLAHVPMLLYLNISLCRRLEPDALKYLSLVPMLTHLNLFYCTSLEADALKHLAFVPMLLYLNISTCRQLEQDALKHLAFVPMLLYLIISNCSQLEPDALKHLALVPMLLHLEISTCRQLERDALKHLAFVPMLLYLIISNCYQLEPDALKHLALVPMLLHLQIEGCEKLEPDALKYLSLVPRLQNLHAQFCKQLIANGLEKLSHLPFLRLLDITGCENFEENSLKNLIHTPLLTKVCIGLTNCRTEFIPKNLANLSIVK